MSISILRLYNRVNDLAKKDQSGYNTVAEFNDRINQVQLEVIEKVFSIIGLTQRASDFLFPFIKTTTITTSNTGLIIPPPDSLHYLSLSYIYADPVTGNVTNIPMRYLNANEVDITATNPNRNANPVRGRVQYYDSNGSSFVTTNSSCTVLLRYIMNPPTAQISFTTQSNSQGYYQVFDPINSIDLIWNDPAYNMIVYLMLEKLGVEIREQFLIEFSQALGIEREKITKND